MQIVLVVLFLSLIPITLLGLAIWLLLPGVRDLKQALASRHWPSTAGKIVSRTVFQIPRVGGSRTSRTREGYRAQILYEYAVGGLDYTATRRVFSDESIAYSSPERAAAVLDDYPSGRTVQVYYDPTNPRTAVLEPGRIGPVLSVLVAGVVCLVLTLFTTWMVLAIALAPHG